MMPERIHIDARMNGCELPVIINSGSGNQGMTCSLPVIEFAKELHSSEEKLYRALVLSNLVTIHQKTGIGRLSAYCSAVCAGAAAGAVMLGYDMYMNGQQFYAGEGIVTEGVDETIRNVGVLGREGMKETNNKIIDIMIHNPN